jgi:hypothetical protein
MQPTNETMGKTGRRYVAHRRLQPLLIAEGAVATFVALKLRAFKMLVIFVDQSGIVYYWF